MEQCHDYSNGEKSASLSHFHAGSRLEVLEVEFDVGCWRQPWTDSGIRQEDSDRGLYSYIIFLSYSSCCTSYSRCMLRKRML